MRRTLANAWVGTAALLLAGCASGPLVENPVLVRADKAPQDNPAYIPNGPMSYEKVWEKTLDVLSDYGFEIAYMDRYAGIIESYPSVAPGIEQPWKPGSPDIYQRFLAYLQTIRHRAIVHINTAQGGGYWIEVKVLNELEDLPSPIRATAGSATFILNTTVQRQFEVIEVNVFEANWIPIGEDKAMEQAILEQLAKCDFKYLSNPTPAASNP